jgi:hypothetical protein
VAERRLELLVVSHVDRDHIEGVLGLLSEEEPGFEVGDVWFNGWPHLAAAGGMVPFGALQGERVSGRIAALGLPWNRAFDGGAVAAPEEGPLPRVVLPGGLALTLLAPGPEALARLRPQWEREVRKANLEVGFALPPNDELALEPFDLLAGGELPDVEALAASPFEKDRSAANASSIALLAEIDGRRALLAADAHAPALVAALDRLSPGERFALDLLKISHHGSKGTTSRELIERVDCSTYLFSTNGAIFRHPHAEAVSRVIVAGGESPRLVFNYRGAHNAVWDLDEMKRRYGYTTTYPAEGGEGVEVALS